MKKFSVLLIVLAGSFTAVFAQGKVMHDTVLIKNAAMDYIEGAYSADEERMGNAIHPEIQKVIPVPLPGTKGIILQYSNYSMLLEGTRAGMGKMPEEQWNIDYELLHWDQNIASVRITSAKYQDYCHLAKTDKGWKIVNVIWRPVR